jgi:hypothetical protein
MIFFAEFIFLVSWLHFLAWCKVAEIEQVLKWACCFFPCRCWLETDSLWLKHGRRLLPCITSTTSMPSIIGGKVTPHHSTVQWQLHSQNYVKFMQGGKARDLLLLLQLPQGRSFHVEGNLVSDWRKPTTVNIWRGMFIHIHHLLKQVQKVHVKYIALYTYPWALAFVSSGLHAIIDNKM